MFSSYEQALDYDGLDNDGTNYQPSAENPTNIDDAGWEASDDESASDPTDLDDAEQRKADLAVIDDTPLSEEDEPDDSAWSLYQDEDDLDQFDTFQEENQFDEHDTREEERTQDEEDAIEEIFLNGVDVTDITLDFDDLDVDEELEHQEPVEWNPNDDDGFMLDTSEVSFENWIDALTIVDPMNAIAELAALSDNFVMTEPPDGLVDDILNELWGGFGLDINP